MDGDDELVASPYTLNCWDCPACGYNHQTDVDLADEETCDGCGATVSVR